MKKQFLSSASALALVFFAGGAASAADIPAEVVVQPQIMESVPSATIALWIGGFFPSGYVCEDCENNDFKDNAFGFGGDARGVYDFNPGWAVQLELMALGHGSTHTSGNTGEKDEIAAHVAVGGHIINRRDGWAWGGFGALTHSNHVEEDEGAQAAVLGLEAAGFFGNSTIFGQVAGVFNIGETTGGTEAIDTGIFGRIGARHFFDPNTKLEGSLAAGTGENTDSTPDDWRWFQAAVEVERKFDNNPLSIFAGYTGDWVEVDESGGCCDEETWVHAFKVGVRMSFGQQTLRDQELYGAETFKFGPWAAPFMYLDELN